MGLTKTVRLQKILKSLIVVVVVDQQEVFQENDFLVTTKSAELTEKFVAQPTKKANHVTIISMQIGESVVPLIKSSQSR